MFLIDQINSHEALYLDRLFEERDLELCVVVDEAKLPGGLETTAGVTAHAPIVSDATCNRYKITFKNYVAYCVTNESCAGIGTDEEFAGNLFRTYSRSAFLDYVAATAGGIIESLGPYAHYEIVALNQIIDVVTILPPEIELVGKQ